MTFGWTWSHIDEEVTLPMLKEIFETWAFRPPVHRMVAGYFRIEKKTTTVPTLRELEQAVLDFKG